MTLDQSITLKCLTRRPMARIRLICVPHAGAGASIYRRWRDYLPEWIELYALQLPGREERLGQPPIQEWSDLQTACSKLFGQNSTMPIAVFGHSLGALIAIEIARQIQLVAPKALQRVFLSGRPAPEPEQFGLDIPNDITIFKNWMVERFGRFDEAMEDKEIADLMLPIMLNDVKLLNSYTCQNMEKLAVNVSIFLGLDDPSTSPVNLKRWADITTGSSEFYEIPGGHLFHMNQAKTVVQSIEETLAPQYI